MVLGYLKLKSEPDLIFFPVVQKIEHTYMFLDTYLLLTLYPGFMCKHLEAWLFKIWATVADDYYHHSFYCEVSYFSYV